MFVPLLVFILVVPLVGFLVYRMMRRSPTEPPQKRDYSLTIQHRIRSRIAKK